jgi:anti-sigma factor RsiW
VTEASHPIEELGALVLGALDSAETAQVREHLAGCPRCRAELDRLSGLPALLRAVPAQAWTTPPRPSELGLVRLLSRMRAERAQARRRSLGWATVLGAAAASVVALAVVIGVHPGSAPVTASPTVHATTSRWRLSGANPARHITGRATVLPVAWGSKLAVELSGVPRGLQCELVVVDRSGHRWDAGSWTVTYAGAVYWSGGVAIGERRISHLEVVTTHGARLLTLS